MYSLQLIYPLLLSSAWAMPTNLREEPKHLQTLTSSDPEGMYFFGKSLAAAGDLNGDGIPDAILSDYANQNGADGDYEGAVYIFHGTIHGILEEVLTLRPPVEDYGLFYYGQSVVGAGDLNGDGFADIAVSESNDDTWGDSSGRLHLYYGTETGLNT